jgi:hypothetical protein
VAFGGLLHDAQVWAELMVAPDASGARRPLVAVATDGETFGHHHRFGEVALAWLLHHLETRSDVQVENFASVLARHPAGQEVRLVAPSSWSCPHGVERWRSDCACRMAPDPAGRPVRYRAALREGLDWLAAELHGLFEREGARLLGDPWQAREGYAVVEGHAEALAPLVAGSTDRVRAAELLELEWNALQMFTSCGWFFDDISGIEAQQVLRYAARAVELAGPDAPRLETGLLARLALAESAVSGVGSGRDLYLAGVQPRLPAPVRVAGGYAAARRLVPRAEVSGDTGYGVRQRGDRVTLTRWRTGRESQFRVTLERIGAAGVAVAVTPADGSPVAHLGLDDLPERYRVPIVAALRTELIARRLSSGERAQLAAGAADVSRLAAAALSRAVARLAQDRSRSAVDAVFDLADLLALQGLHVPFDAQTTFVRVRARAGPRSAAALAAVARRLGFAEVPGGG